MIDLKNVEIKKLKKRKKILSHNKNDIRVHCPLSIQYHRVKFVELNVKIDNRIYDCAPVKRELNNNRIFLHSAMLLFHLILNFVKSIV